MTANPPTDEPRPRAAPPKRTPGQGERDVITYRLEFPSSLSSTGWTHYQEYLSEAEAVDAGEELAELGMPSYQITEIDRSEHTILP